MENECMRCGRDLSDPNAVFGWRCAEILGVSEILSEMEADVFRKFIDGFMKVRRLFGKSNILLSDQQWKNLYSAFAKMSLWDGISEDKVKQARKDSYLIINGIKAKYSELSDSLAEYKNYIENHGLLSGTSKLLAKNDVLDNVTNSVLKIHDQIWNEDMARKLLTAGLYDYSHSKIADRNYEYNKKVDLSSYHNGYINDQNSGAVSKLKFGTDVMKNNGCEVIAIYNTMKTLGNQKDIRDIAYYFENDGQMLFGAFGTNPYSAIRYFEDEGYKIKTVEGEDIVNKKIPDADAYVLSFWNSDDVMDMLHTVSLREVSANKYEIYNDSAAEKFNDEGQSIAHYVRINKYVPLTLHCITKE